MSVEIKYKGKSELGEVEGRTVDEVRSHYQGSWGFTENARAVLNGRRVEREREGRIKLHDYDELTFVERSRSRLPLLVGALALAMAITGGLFAFTYVNTTKTIAVTAMGADFASITENITNAPTWTTRGFFKGSTGAGNLYDIDTAASGYTGDFVITISVANGDQLAEVYRVLALKVELYDGGGNKVDVNGDATVDDKDFVLLTLSNGEANLFVTQNAPSIYTAKLVSGYYISNIWGGGWTSGYEDPLLFAEVSQR